MGPGFRKEVGAFMWTLKECTGGGPTGGYSYRGTSLSLPLPTQRYKGADFAIRLATA